MSTRTDQPQPSRSQARDATRRDWLMLAPLGAVMLAIVGYPLAQTILLAFTDTRLLQGFAASHWIGLENFGFVLTDLDFLAAFQHTLYFMIVSVGLEAVLGVLVGLLLNQEFKGRTVARALLVLPWALPTIVNALMWRLIYHPDYGGLNAALTQTGLATNYQSWLGSEAGAMNAIIVADVWKNYPLVALIVLAALQNAPKELYEAARLDGANAWQTFWTVTWPVILPPLLVALVLRSIEALKVFDIVYVMTRGGPANATKTVSFFVYQESFGFDRAGSGASYALVIVLAALVLVGLYVRLLARQETPA